MLTKGQIELPSKRARWLTPDTVYILRPFHMETSTATSDHYILDGPYYLHFLREYLNHLDPRYYLEIGVNLGKCFIRYSDK